MSIPSKQIGWSQESNLLWEILKELNRLQGIVSGSIAFGITTGIDISGSSYDMTEAHHYYEVTVSSNVNTVNFPNPADFKGQQIIVKNSDTINVDFGGLYIPAIGRVFVGNTVIFISDGTVWAEIANFN